MLSYNIDEFLDWIGYKKNFIHWTEITHFFKNVFLNQAVLPSSWQIVRTKNE